jgi:hypothetical protein
MVKHKDGCIELQKMEDRELFKQAWPEHCTKCEGWGGFWHSFDPSPSGVSLSAGSMMELDPCEDCVVLGKCPRCGLQDDAEVSDEFEHCRSCDWRWDFSDGMPEYDICGCEYPIDQADIDALEDLPF